MAGVPEKARFYLERTVPQLREWEEKNIFSSDEIRNIVKRRNDYEHQILAPRAPPAQFIAYAQYEQSLSALVAKRVQRLKIRHMATAKTFSARPASILERAVNRHPSCVPLWHAYLDRCADAGAGPDGAPGRASTKRWRRGMTRALRMLPTEPSLWVLAGRKAVADGDWEGARGMFMRGCRFCVDKGMESVWLEYARSELEWLERAERKNRGKLAGSGAGNGPKELLQEPEDGGIFMFDSDSNNSDDDDDDENDGEGLGKQRFALPEPRKDAPDTAALVENSPALTGAIPLSVYDICSKQPLFNAEVAAAFFELFASFDALTVRDALAQHVLNSMVATYPRHPAALNCYVRQPLLGVSPHTAEFARGLRTALGRLQESLEKTGSGPTGAKATADLVQRTTRWIDEVLAVEGLDQGLRTVLESTKGKIEQVEG